MQVVLVIPVAGLVAGAALGLRWPEVPTALLLAALCGWTLLAVHAARVSNQALLATAACGAFAVGGAALAERAWQDAWRPSLRVIVESIARDQRAADLRAGLAVPEDDGATVALSGVLRTDASLSPGGAVSLAVDVEWIGRVDGGDAGTRLPIRSSAACC